MCIFSAPECFHGPLRTAGGSSSVRLAVAGNTRDSGPAAKPVSYLPVAIQHMVAQDQSRRCQMRANTVREPTVRNE